MTEKIIRRRHRHIRRRHFLCRHFYYKNRRNKCNICRHFDSPPRSVYLLNMLC
jgi:hypothetical protein